jgi:hypothetical protein
MRQTEHLAVEIASDRIIVSMPNKGPQVTYCKDPVSPMLTMVDPLRAPTPERLDFLAKAWKVAHQTAQKIGWLRS